MIGFAWAMLFLWPVVAIVLFRTQNPLVAMVLTLLGGYLLLPAGLGIDLPLLPALNKSSISVIAAMLFTAIVMKQNLADVYVLEGWTPKSAMANSLMICLFLGVFGTIFTNTDVLVYGPRVLSALSARDIISVIVEISLIIAPLFLGRKLIASPQAQRTFLKLLVIAALLYSLAAVWEVRMSPQLHRQFYGYFPHSFGQQIRGDGFRPVIFLGHGLAVARFFVFAAIAAAVLVRISEGRERLMWAMAVVWFVIVVILCKTLGALMILGLLLPIALFMGMRSQLIIALCIAGTILSYPILRSANLIPVDRVMEFAASVDAQRAQSFGVRLFNEEILLEKAMDRPVFGWGGWGRQRVFDETGRDISITDGSWLIVLGGGGWVRYLGFFGLMCLPILIGAFRKPPQVDLIFSGMTLILCVKLINIIPNSGSEPFVWLCVGSLMGRLERKSWEKNNSPQPTTHKRRDLKYARDLMPARHDEYASSNKPLLRSNQYRRIETAKGHRR